MLATYGAHLIPKRPRLISILIARGFGGVLFCLTGLQDGHHKSRVKEKVPREREQLK